MTAVSAWVREGACVGSYRIYDVAADLLEANPESTAPEVTHCLDICSSCQVKLICLGRAMENRDTWSVAGGTTPDQRAELEAREWLLSPSFTERHGRSCATSGRCDCAEGKRAHAAYVKQWRAQGSSHTRRDREDVEQLTMWEAE